MKTGCAFGVRGRSGRGRGVISIFAGDVNGLTAIGPVNADPFFAGEFLTDLVGDFALILLAILEG